MIEALQHHRIALVLAGGNALGAYQAGACEALIEGGLEPNEVVGTSVGAINGAVIAGNPPSQRVPRLKALWRPRSAFRWPTWWEAMPETVRRTGEVTTTLLAGRQGLFAPAGSAALAGTTPRIYDTKPLLATLAEIVDFERLNAGELRFAAMAVDLGSGDETLFDSARQVIGPAHLRASAAMPPSFPAIEIDGRLFVDGGLSANLPLDPVLQSCDDRPLLCIAIDLLPSAAPLPMTIGDVIGRAQDLVFSSQSRRTITNWRHVFATCPSHANRSVTLIMLSYADQQEEVAGKAMDFSAATVRRRWDRGKRDGQALLASLATGAVPLGGPGLAVHDISSLQRF